MVVYSLREEEPVCCETDIERAKDDPRQGCLSTAIWSRTLGRDATASATNKSGVVAVF